MTPTATGTNARATVRSEIAPWAILVLAAVISAVAFSSADTTTREARRAIGNGIGTYTRVSTTRNGVLSVAAWIVLSAGLAAWAVLLSRKHSGRKRWLWPAIAIAAIVVSGWMTAEPFTVGDGWADFERYANAAAVTEAMRAGGDACASTSAREAASAGGLYRERLTCRLPSLADIRDGHDDVTIDFFTDDSARTRWAEAVDHADAFAVLGPDWAITCEFQSTCARIQNSIGGRNY